MCPGQQLAKRRKCAAKRLVTGTLFCPRLGHARPAGSGTCRRLIGVQYCIGASLSCFPLLIKHNSHLVIRDSHENIGDKSILEYFFRFIWIYFNNSSFLSLYTLPGGECFFSFLIIKHQHLKQTVNLTGIQRGEKLDLFRQKGHSEANSSVQPCSTLRNVIYVS